MSNKVYALIQDRKVGDGTQKSILLYLAGFASDDGSGVWLSKGSMSAQLEWSKRTIQRSISSLVKSGLLSVVGERPCKNGSTIEYDINLEAVKSLPKAVKNQTGDRESRVTESHGRGDRESPQGVSQCHPNSKGIVKEPKESVPAHILSKAISTDLANEFVEYRKQIKKPMTARAAELMVEKVKGFPNPETLFKESMMNGWAGVFPKNNQQQQTTDKVSKYRAYAEGRA